MATELLSCPFCGSSNVGFKDCGGPDEMAGCNNCGVQTKWHRGRAEAITAWNTRATLSQPSPDIEELVQWLRARAADCKQAASDIGEDDDEALIAWVTRAETYAFVADHVQAANALTALSPTPDTIAVPREVWEEVRELLRRGGSLIAVAADNKDPLQPVADNGMTVWDCFVTESSSLTPRFRQALARLAEGD